MMSATARARRRGGIPASHFLAELRRAGLVEVPADWGNLHEFIDRNGNRYVMPMRDTYSRALDRILLEITPQRPNK
jgi:hypothetical protein